MLDSGPLENLRAESAVLFSQDVDLGADVPWVRVLFDKETTLSPGSFIRVTSLLDGESQILDAQELKNWSYGTAFFNGSTVQIEVIGGREAKNDRVRISEVYAGGVIEAQEAQEAPAEGGVADICGGADGRGPSFDPRVGRLIIDKGVLGTFVCTGFIIDTPAGSNKGHLSAGHCFDGALSAILQFGVPPSVACVRVNPPVKQQFPVVNVIFANTTCADVPVPPAHDDWAVFHCGTNENGQTTYETQGAAFKLANSIPNSGNVQTIGYGTDGGLVLNACGPCVAANVPDSNRRFVQQTAKGPLVAPAACGIGKIPGTLHHQVDSCGGESGGPIINQSNGLVIGMDTTNGCKGAICCPGVAADTGTRIDRPGLIAAIADCKGKASVPTLSEWGLVALAVSLVAAMVIKFGRRRAVTT
jgi:hypothetical protein